MYNERDYNFFVLDKAAVCRITWYQPHKLKIEIIALREPVHDEANMLLVHYADMKKDLDGEMRRIAEFLDIEVAEELWPKLVDAARFDSMKGKAAELMPTASDIWQGGGDTFLHKGTNGRWRDVANKEDLDVYDARVKAEFPPELSHWIEFGRLG